MSCFRFHGSSSKRSQKPTSKNNTHIDTSNRRKPDGQRQASSGIEFCFSNSVTFYLFFVEMKCIAFDHGIEFDVLTAETMTLEFKVLIFGEWVHLICCLSELVLFFFCIFVVDVIVKFYLVFLF